MAIRRRVREESCFLFTLRHRKAEIGRSNAVRKGRAWWRIRHVDKNCRHVTAPPAYCDCSMAAPWPHGCCPGAKEASLNSGSLGCDSKGIFRRDPPIDGVDKTDEVWLGFRSSSRPWRSSGACSLEPLGQVRAVGVTVVFAHVLQQPEQLCVLFSSTPQLPVLSLAPRQIFAPVVHCRLYVLSSP